MQLLRSLLPTLPIFFVHIPSPDELSGLTEVDRNELMNHGGLNFTSEKRFENGINSHSSSESLDDENDINKDRSAVIDQLVLLGEIDNIIIGLFNGFC